MAVQKLYAGAKLRELRGRMNITQKEFAEKLGVSLPYLNQMENNNRPISTGVVLGLAQEFGFDVTELQSGDEARLMSDMREALADPIFTSAAPSMADLRLAASNAPALARAFLELHNGYRQTHERLASLDEALGREDARLGPSPWEEVRDFFHYCDNYLDAVDRAAERFSDQLQQGEDIIDAAVRVLRGYGVTVTWNADAVRHFDPKTRILSLSAQSAKPTQTFQLLMQMALIAHGYPQCSGPVPKVSRSFSCASIKREQSQSGTLPRHCNLQDTAARARCGTCMPLSRHRDNFCDNTFALPAMSASQAVHGGHRRGAMRLVLGAKSNMPTPWSMLTTCKSAPRKPLI